MWRKQWSFSVVLLLSSLFKFGACLPRTVIAPPVCRLRAMRCVRIVFRLVSNLRPVKPCSPCLVYFAPSTPPHGTVLIMLFPCTFPPRAFFYRSPTPLSRLLRCPTRGLAQQYCCCCFSKGILKSLTQNDPHGPNAAAPALHPRPFLPTVRHFWTIGDHGGLFL